MKRLNFDVTYKGIRYKRVADFAKAVGLDTRVVLARYRDMGWRDAEKLAQPLIDYKTRKGYSGSYPIVYKNVEYESLAVFARSFGLSYTTVLRHWHSGRKSPEFLIENCKPTTLKATAKILLKQKKEDEKAKEDYIKKLGLLSVSMLAKKTGISPSTIRSTVYNFQEKHKNDVATIGLMRSDIVYNIIDNPQTQKSISNVVVLPKYAFKPIAVDHIKMKQNYVKSLNLVKIPNLPHYYYDLKNERVWSDAHGNLREISKRKDSWTIRSKKKEYFFKAANLMDYIKYPEITADDLLTYHELSDLCNVKVIWWRNNGIAQSVFPKMRRRYNFTTGKAKRGFDKKELIKAFAKNDKTKPFVEKIKQAK